LKSFNGWTAPAPDRAAPSARVQTPHALFCVFGLARESAILRDG